MALFDAVYPLGKGSKLENLELRFSLRSLEKHAKNLGKVWIIGQKPDFLNWNEGLIHIPFDDAKRACVNVWEKLKTIAEDERITERFVWMNDDFYILQDFDAGNIPNFARGGELLHMTSGKARLLHLKVADITHVYHRVLKLTLEALKKRGLRSFKFSTHQPINLERSKVLATFNEFKAEAYRRPGLSFRCCYGNMHRLERRVSPTQIVNNNNFKIPANRLAFASHENIDRELLMSELIKLYPTPSRFEARPL